MDCNLGLPNEIKPGREDNSVDALNIRSLSTMYLMLVYY